MQAHAHDLRAEVGKVIQDPTAADSYVHAIACDWRTAPLSDVDLALCTFAAKLTQRQDKMTQADLDALRSKNLSDAAIHDAVQVIGFFNYLTRVADALGVEPESFIDHWGCQAYEK
jgi:uncharacterized peroxidase-related enzyme